MKLAQRFNFLVIPLVVLPLLSLGHITYVKLFEGGQEKSFSTMESVLSQLNQGLEQAARSARSATDLLAADLTMQQYALIKNDSDRYAIYQRSLLKRFRVYIDSDPRYQEVRFLLPDGYEDAHWGKPGIFNTNDEEADNWWFDSLQAGGEKHIQFVDTNPDTGNKALYVFLPLLLRDVAAEGVNTPRTLRGFIGVTLDLAWLQAEIDTLSTSSEFLVAFISPAGRQLLYSETVPMSGRAELLSAISSHSNAWNGEGAREFVVGGTPYYLDTTSSLQGHSFVTAAPESRINRAARELSLKVALLTLAAIVIAVAVLSLFMRRVIIMPLRKLIHASNNIGSGKLGTHISVKGGGELSDLADSFNRMARELAHSDEQIRYIAHHDTLTKLPNRHLFQLYLNKSIASARRSHNELALLFLDIDHFKTVNDTLGHDAGDELLRLFADRIGHCLREEDFYGLAEGEATEDLLARHGGDEFTIILPRIEGVWSAAVVAQRIIDSLAEDILLQGHVLKMTTSIGITMYPRDGNSMEALLKCADIAMYQAKEKGRNNYQFYTSEMMENIVDRIEWEKELRLAIKQGDMTLHYQPQIFGDSEELYGFEALVRWEHSERGIISPLRFIHLAEETGLIIELGAWVMRESCRQAAHWYTQGLDNLRMSVNVSSVQFSKQDVAALIAQALQESGLPGENLTVELTESILMSADSNTWEQLQCIQDLGVSIALDDFGTGYSSLSYLRTFPVDILKVDRSFIIDSEHNAEVRAIVAAIISMAKALNLQVVAEGVEEEAQVRFLKDINCDVIQGFYYARPLPAGEAAAFCRQYLKSKQEVLSVA